MFWTMLALYLVGAFVAFIISAWNNDIEKNQQFIISCTSLWPIWFLCYLPRNLKWIWNNLIIWTWNNIGKY